MVTKEKEDNDKPRCCGECTKFIRREKDPTRGWCDNWAGIDMHEDYVCNPNFGKKRSFRSKT